MIIAHLNALKTKGNYSWQDLSDLTGIPVPTIRKTFSGETVNPSFEVVTKLVTAMGGSLSDLIEAKEPDKGAAKESTIPKPEETEDMQAMMEQMKLLYEARIADLWHMIDKLTAERKTLFFTMITLVMVLLTFIVYLFLDGMHGNWGFFRY